MPVGRWHEVSIIQTNAVIRGVLLDALVTVGQRRYGSEALELTYKSPAGRAANRTVRFGHLGQDHAKAALCGYRCDPSDSAGP